MAMKLPLSWLNEYVNVADLTVRDLSDKLTFSGVEVEGIHTVGHDYAGFVVGEVRACAPHPNADRLRLCTVFDGARELPVVCGAPNVAAGQKVCLAALGAALPDGTRIKKAKIRGAESLGMLCAADELGLSADHSGLLVLDPSAVPGTPLAQVLPPPETVLELEITWNRPDCLSVIGIAREFAALLGRPLTLPPVTFAESGDPVETLAKVRIEAPADCPRYVARVLTGVKDGPSPAWMQRRLELCGVRPISLIVDVTNYVMLECGQPQHAFDYHRIAEHTIVVRRAAPGERMATLDGLERPLDAETLVIADAARPVAVAGIMGGAGSEIAVGSTDSVLLESALFAAPRIKHTATRLALRTESSHRFERGVDTGLADWASRRAAHLLAAHGGATVAAGAIDADFRPAGPRTVTLRHRRAREVIGVDLPAARMHAILSSLGLARTAAGEGADTYQVPSWRLDLECEADLIEEVARIHGLAAIPDVLPAAVAVPGASDAPMRAAEACRATLLGLGFTEAMHYSFLSAAELDAFDAASAGRRLVLPNPVSADYAVMRDALLPQLVASLGRNYARQAETPMLFEMGRVFCRDSAGRPAEAAHLAIGLCGPAGRSVLDRRRPVENEEALLWVKGALEALAARLHAGALDAVAPSHPHPAFAAGWSADVRLDGTVIGHMGLLTAALRHPWRVNTPVAVAEVRLDPLLARSGTVSPLQPVPPYPGVRRDLALIAPHRVTHGEITAAIRSAGGAELTHVSLFDIFEAKETGREKRSLAYALEFRSSTRTLTDEEVNAALQSIVAALKRDLPVEVREG